MQPKPIAWEAHVWLLAAVVVGAALVYGPNGGVDGIVVSKATMVVLVAIVAAVVAGLAAVRSAASRVPWHPAIAMVGVVGLAMILRVAVAEYPLRGVLGSFERWNGLALYLACFVLFVVASDRGSDAAAHRYLRALVVGGILVGLYGLDEAYWGFGPNWSARGHVAGTLGNSNFYGAWLACVLGPALAVVLDRNEARGWRLTGAVAIPLVLWSVQASGAMQAVLVVAVVAAVIVLAWAVDNASRSAFLSLAAGMAAVASVGALLTVLGVMGRGPGGFLGADRSVQRRIDHWRTAGRMVAEHPVGGVGPALFPEQVRIFRSVEEAMFNPSLARVPGSVHNALLQVFAEWGTPIGLAYVAVLVVVLVAMVRELTRRSGGPRLRYAGLAALWLGYLAQSLVSIDSPPLIVLGWVTAGLLLAPQASSRRWVLPWPARGRSRRHSQPGRAQAVTAAVLLGGLVAGWAALIPLRADAASRDSEIRLHTGADVRPAASTRATDLAPWESQYWMQLAKVLIQEGKDEYVLAVVEQAYAVSADSFAVVLNAARMSHRNGEPNKARRYYEKALRLEPHLPDLRTEVARFALDRGDDDWARALLEAALEVDPEHAEANELQDAMEAAAG